VIFEEFGIQDDNDGLTNCQLGENVCGNLTRKMKEQHVFHDLVSSEEFALIQKTSILVKNLIILWSQIINNL
jgi:hypothetical protein